MNIFWDIQNRKLVSGFSAVSALGSMTLVLRDVYPITLAICDPSTAAYGVNYVARPLAAGESIAFALKPPASLSGDSLIPSGSWVLSGAGTAARYAGTWNLNTQPLAAALGSLTTLALKAEFTIIGSDNAHQCSTQFDVNVIPDVYRAADVGAAALHNFVEAFTDSDGINKLRFVNADGQTVGIMAPP